MEGAAISNSPVEHERVERRMASADLEISASEAHGMLCGLLCGNRDPRERWFTTLFETTDEADLLARECRQILGVLYSQTREALEGEGVAFTPLLPEESQSLMTRAEAVCDWCRGFLYGLGLTGITEDTPMSDDSREALHDMSEITRMDLSGLVDSEEDENSLMHIMEHIWVAATLVYHDYLPNKRTH